MLKLMLRVLVEILIGVSLAGVVLAASVPVLIRYELVTPGDLAGTFVIAGALVIAVGGMLFRRGSALNRYRK